MRLVTRTQLLKRNWRAHSEKYTSHQIQNEILDTFAEMVMESEAFALMADETKDTKRRNRFLQRLGIITGEL